MTLRKNIIVSILLLTVASFVGFFYFKSRDNAEIKKGEQAVLVETSQVKEGFFSERFETLGNLNSTDSIDISAEIAGHIEAIYFTPGQTVKKGQLLVQLDDQIYQSELDSAEASLKLSQMNFNRTSELSKRKLSSAQALDQAQADLKEKENTVKVKRAQLEKSKIRAPFSGTLGARSISIGQHITIGQALVHITATEKMRLNYRMPERYLSKLSRGQEVLISSDAYPDKLFRGKINYIDPAIDKDTRTIAVEALIDNKDKRLYDGLFVQVTHLFGQKQKKLLIPEESIIPAISHQKIFVIKNNRAFAVKIKTGTHHADMVEVKSGLQKGDNIVVRGQQKLKDGMKIIDSKLS